MYLTHDVILSPLHVWYAMNILFLRGLEKLPSTALDSTSQSSKYHLKTF